MIRTYLELDVEPGEAETLAATFARESILQTSVDQVGCHSAELTISADGRTAVVTATWDDVDAYGRWTSRTDRSGLSSAMSACLTTSIDETTKADVFNIALSAIPPESKQSKESEQGS